MLLFKKVSRKIPVIGSPEAQFYSGLHFILVFCCIAFTINRGQRGFVRYVWPSGGADILRWGEGTIPGLTYAKDQTGFGLIHGSTPPLLCNAPRAIWLLPTGIRYCVGGREKNRVDRCQGSHRMA